MQHKMRKFIAIIAFAFIALGVQAQDGTVFTVDTLDDSETLTFTYGATIKNMGTLVYHVACDSIDGTPTGTIYYEWSTDKDGTEWHAAATDTITNAAATDQSHTITNFGAYRARIRIVGGATQEVEVSPSISFKRN